jgi:hypothetical protein
MTQHALFGPATLNPLEPLEVAAEHGDAEARALLDGLREAAAELHQVHRSHGPGCARCLPVVMRVAAILDRCAVKLGGMEVAS